MKILLAFSFLFLSSCQSAKKAGNCSTATGFGVMEAGTAPISLVDKVEGSARIPVKVITLPIQLVAAGGGLVVGAPFIVVGAVLGDEW